MSKIVKTWGIIFFLLFALVFSLYKYAQPKLGGVDPSSTREIIGSEEYSDNGVPSVRYTYKTAKIVGKNILNDHTELLDSKVTKDKNGKDIKENTYKIYPSPQFTQQGADWYGLDYATTTKDKFVKPIASLFFNSAHATCPSTSCFGTNDGSVERRAAEDWATIRAGAGTWISNQNGVGWDMELYYAVTWQRMPVAKGDFDTSAVSPLVVTAATLNLNCHFKAGTAQSFKMTSAGSEVLGTATYTNHLTNMATEYSVADVSSSSMTCNDTTYYSWTFNPAGIAAINTTGTTYIGLRNSNEFNNSESQNGDQEVWFNDSASTGTSLDPYLSITASAPIPPPYRADVYNTNGE